MARDSGGTYTRVSNDFSNPVAGTAIDPTHASAYFDDVQTEMTDSLCRSGKGSMLANLSMGGFAITTASQVQFKGSSSGFTVLAPTAAASGTLTLPAATDTLVGKATTDTLTNKTIDTAGPNTIKINGNTLSATAGSATVTVPNSTDTLVGKATTDTLTNKTFDTAGAGNVFKINGTTISVNTGTGSNVLATSPTLVTPTLGAASATSLTFSSTTGIVGTTTNDSAAAGSVGEYIESVIAQASAVSLVSNTAKDITTITITAGDWDIDANLGLVTAATTSVTQMFACVSSGATNTMDFTNGRATGQVINATVPTAGANYFLPVQPVRFSVSGSTTIRLIALTTFTASTLTGFGLLRARRVR